MKALVANEDCTITITPLSGATPGIVNYTQHKASMVNAGSGKMLVDKIEWTVSGCTLAGGYAGGTLNPKAMNATAARLKCDRKAVMRLGDSGLCSGQLTAPPPATPVSCSCRFAITAAGQPKVKAE